MAGCCGRNGVPTSIDAGEGIDLTGSGTASSPYVIAVENPVPPGAAEGDTLVWDCSVAQTNLWYDPYAVANWSNSNSTRTLETRTDATEGRIYYGERLTAGGNLFFPIIAHLPASKINLFLDPYALGTAATTASGATVVRVPDATYGGAYEITKTAAVGTAGYGGLRSLSLTASTSYTISFWMNAPADAAGMSLFYRPNNSSSVTTGQVQLLSGALVFDGTWRRYTTTFTTTSTAPGTSPSGLTAQFFTGSAIGAAVKITGVVVRTGTVGAAEMVAFSGDTPDTPGFDYAWAGTPRESFSTVTAAALAPNTQYTLVMDLKAGNFGGSINYRADGTASTTTGAGQVGLGTMNVFDQWTTKTITFTTDATVNTNPALTFFMGSATAVGTRFMVRNIALFAGNPADKTVFSGDTPDTAETTYAWTDAPYLSTSTRSTCSWVAGEPGVTAAEFAALSSRVDALELV